VGAEEKHQRRAGSLLRGEHYSLTFCVHEYHPASRPGVTHPATYKTYMKLVRKEPINAITSSAVTQQLPEQNDKRHESRFLPLAAVYHLVTGRFAADIFGVAAELLSAGGFRLSRIIPTTSFVFVIEAICG
jgi:hypothetical protein